jgi:hypothetical protein
MGHTFAETLSIYTMDTFLLDHGEEISSCSYGISELVNLLKTFPGMRD